MRGLDNLMLEAVQVRVEDQGISAVLKIMHGRASMVVVVVLGRWVDVFVVGADGEDEFG